MTESDEQRADAEMRRYLKKVLNSLFGGAFWMLVMVFFGLYLKWAIPYEGRLIAFNYIFYAIFLVTLILLLRYYWKIWK